jgi:hypothetical protein
LDLGIAIIDGEVPSLGIITNQNNLFSMDFKIRFKKFGIAIDPGGWSGLSYRRRNDELRSPILSMRLVKRNLIFQNIKQLNPPSWICESESHHGIGTRMC